MEEAIKYRCVKLIRLLYELNWNLFYEAILDPSWGSYYYYGNMIMFAVNGFNYRMFVVDFGVRVVII